MTANSSNRITNGQLRMRPAKTSTWCFSGEAAGIKIILNKPT